MVNDQVIVSDQPDRFLDYLLRCGLTAPGAEASPTAGRILARLLVVGAVEGGDDLIAPYLVPAPGEAAVFEVRTYRPGDLVPTDVRDGLGAATALKTALRTARETDDGIEVVSRGTSGVERCVLVRDSTGDFEFRFASGETMIGDPTACSQALMAWSDLFARWRDATPPAGDEASWAPPPLVVRPGPDRSMGQAAASMGQAAPSARPAPPPAEEAPTTGARGWWTSGADDRPAEAEAGGRATEEAPAIATASAPVTVPADDGEDRPVAASGRDAPPAQDARTSGDAGPAGDARDTEELSVRGDTTAGPAVPPAPEARAWATVGAELGSASLEAAIQQAIGNLVVEVDLGQVEQLIRRVLDDDRREMVEPLARRLSARIGESLDLPDTRALVDAVSLVLPRPGELAGAVASDVGALLSETVLRRRPGELGGGIDGPTLLAALEHLSVRVDGLEDQFHHTATLLKAMGEHLAAGDRRAATAERITISVDHEMQRLANRIDEQVAALASSAGGGSELSDGVARLTRKLRQSVAELDRARERLDQLVDQVAGEGGGQLGSIRGPGAAGRSGAAVRR
ncbi:MAG TPA: hypothetical protein VHT75_16045 [Acidimicrobiales bacterium]|jgi:hypothetical protein|nr:hypothetical protein [Acidimicrobiales bacterium]